MTLPVIVVDVCVMSVTQIITELPKLTAADLPAVRRKLIELLLTGEPSDDELDLFTVLLHTTSVRNRIPLFFTP